MKWLLCTLFVLGLGATAQAQSASPICGDGIVDASEFCDDGNTQDGDYCSSNCLFGAPPSYYQSPNAYPQHTKQINPGGAFAMTLASSFFTFGVSPSIGHLYAGEYKRALTSWGIRMGGYVLFVGGAGFLILTSFDDGGGSSCSINGFGCGAGALYFGGATVLGSLLFDVIDAPSAAIRSNQKGRRPWQYSFAPTPMPALGGGMSLKLRF